MFGLMRPHHCCSTKKTATYKTHRMHYCGTCKTIGNHYGHSARLGLNYDIVFLSELLSELSKEDLSQWEENYQAINKCLKMPKETTEMPFSLVYSAHANMVLLALKLDDHIKDNTKWRWKILRLLGYTKFKKAFKQLRILGVETSDLWKWIDLQVKRESTIDFHKKSLEEYIKYYAEPTAQITSIVFEKGGKNLPPETLIALKNLGYQFGQINYLLDAFEDLEQDIFSKQFNPLVHWFQAEKTLQNFELDQVRQLLFQFQEKFNQELNLLPISDVDLFSTRLNSNLMLRLYKERIIPKTLNEKFQIRLSKAKEIAATMLCKENNGLSSIQYFLISFFAFLTPALATKMQNEHEITAWSWQTYFSNIFTFSNSDELLDNDITSEAPIDESLTKKKKDNFCFDCCPGLDCACAECFGGCGESASCCEGCGSCAEGCGSCAEGCGSCAEGCGGCAECCGACSC